MRDGQNTDLQNGYHNILLLLRRYFHFLHLNDSKLLTSNGTRNSFHVTYTVNKIINTGGRAT
jgi:hypothetical protein